jgi:hypothetical protein
MARSVRRNPFSGTTTAASDKAWKVQAHRAERRVVRHAIASGRDVEFGREVRHIYGNPWDGPKDGKVRFDPNTAPQLMRK